MNVTGLWVFGGISEGSSQFCYEPETSFMFKKNISLKKNSK